MGSKCISVICKNCGFPNRIPINKFYDGYEGPFLCERCKRELEIENILDDE